MSVRMLVVVFAKQAVTTNAQRTAGYLHGVHFVLLDVVVDGTSIDVHDPGGTSHSHDFDVFTATRTPDFVPENQRRLRHTLSPSAEQRQDRGFSSATEHACSDDSFPHGLSFLTRKCDLASLLAVEYNRHFSPEHSPHFSMSGV